MAELKTTKELMVSLYNRGLEISDIADVFEGTVPTSKPTIRNAVRSDKKTEDERYAAGLQELVSPTDDGIYKEPVMQYFVPRIIDKAFDTIRSRSIFDKYEEKGGYERLLDDIFSRKLTPKDMPGAELREELKPFMTSFLFEYAAKGLSRDKNDVIAATGEYARELIVSMLYCNTKLKSDQIDRIERAISQLPESQEKTVRLRYGIPSEAFSVPKTGEYLLPKQIAELLEVTRQNVSQSETGGIRNLRENPLVQSIRTEEPLISTPYSKNLKDENGILSTQRKMLEKMLISSVSHHPWSVASEREWNRYDVLLMDVSTQNVSPRLANALSGKHRSAGPRPRSSLLYHVVTFPLEQWKDVRDVSDKSLGELTDLVKNIGDIEQMKLQLGMNLEDININKELIDLLARSRFEYDSQ